MALAGLISCSSDKPKTLGEQKAKLKQYRQQEQKLQAQINELEATIAEKDTTKARDYQLVSLERITEGPFQHYVEIRGKANTDQNVEVSPERSGRIETITCEEGDQVQQGELLVKLDSETIERNIDQIQTNLAHARNLYERQANLWEKEIGSEVKYLQAKNRVENLEKELEAARSRLANTTITAPIDGKVDAIFSNPGEMANPASKLLRIINLRQMEVTANPSEAYLDDVQTGDSVIVSFPNLNIRRKRPVTHVSSYIDPDTRTFEITVDIANKNRLIRPNVLAQVRFADYSLENALTVPTKLIQSADTGDFVYTAKPRGDRQVVQQTFIEAGRSNQGITEVKQGVEPGQQLVTDGFREVSHNETVVTP
jgi:RND family efflux transporter MFP subunit